CPTNLVLWTCESNLVFQYPAPQVTGGCPPYSVSCMPPPGAPFPIGITAVVCQVVDGCRNQDSCTFTITVRLDSASPVIECPSNIVVHACPSSTGACGAVVNYPPPSATDESGSVAVDCTPAYGTFFHCGDHIVTCVAEDRCRNTDFCRFQVTVLEGGQPPSIQCPSEVVITTCSNTAVVAYPPPVVNPPGTTVVCVPPAGVVLPL